MHNNQWKLAVVAGLHSKLMAVSVPASHRLRALRVPEPSRSQLAARELRHHRTDRLHLPYGATNAAATSIAAARVLCYAGRRSAED